MKRPFIIAWFLASHTLLAFAPPVRKNRSDKNRALFFGRVSDTTAPQERTRPNESHFVLPTAPLLSAILATTVLLLPLQEAQAGFGPSGGATTSPTPGVGKINVQDLSQKKLKQVIGTSMDEGRLNDFQSQLDSIIENLAQKVSDATEEDGIVDKVTQNALQKLKPEETTIKQFKEEIARREYLLDKLEAQPWYFNYFAAFCGSVISTLVMHPIDTIKTRLMLAGDDNRKKFKNLYEGLGGNILKEGPPSAVYLGVYESVKSSILYGKLGPLWASLLGVGASGIQVVNSDPTYLLSVYLLAGAAGELVGSTIRAPAEAMKSLVQAGTAPSFTDAFGAILLKEEGRQNVFRAWSSSALRDIPFGAIQLALFELIKSYILNNPNIDFDSSTLQSEAIIGAFAGGTGAFLTTGMDVITTRIITQETAGTEEAVGVFEMGRRILEEEGPMAFLSGWQYRLLYWAPAISIFLTSYCSIRQLAIQLNWFP